MIAALGLLFILPGIVAQTSVQTQLEAQRLAKKLLGSPLATDDPLFNQISVLLAMGTRESRMEAAELLTHRPEFYLNTIPYFNSYADRLGLPYPGMTQTSAFGLGILIENLDVRKYFLSADFLYSGNENTLGNDFNYAAGVADTIGNLYNHLFYLTNNFHYTYVEQRFRVNHLCDLTQVGGGGCLERRSPELWSGSARRLNPEPAGIISTYKYAEKVAYAGTLRRTVQEQFKDFLCRSLTEMRDSSMPDDLVRRDVSRAPGGSARTYQTECRSCHAGLDGISKAYSRYDWFYIDANNYGRVINYKGISDGYTDPPEVNRRKNQNSAFYPEGYRVADYGGAGLNSTQWVNNYVSHQNASIGWRNVDHEGQTISYLTGTGPEEWGLVLAHTDAFSKCFVQRIFRYLCHRNFTAEELSTVVPEIDQQFAQSGYSLRTVWAAVAAHPACFQMPAGGTP